MHKLLLVLACAGALAMGPSATARSNQHDSPELRAFEEAVDPVQGRGRPRCTVPQEQLNFRNFWAGLSFDGLDLTSVERRCDLPDEEYPTRFNAVTYSYGECTSPDAGCAPPISVQTWPVQERYRKLYEIGLPEFQSPHEEETFNGFPAVRFEDQLEIFHPDVTVVVFGDDRAQIDRFASALVEGPVVLTDLANHGFSWECYPFSGIDVYCSATKRTPVDAVTEFLAPFGQPYVPTIGFFLVAIVAGRRWVFLLPMAWWLLYSFGLNRLFGVGLGENWQFLVAIFIAVGVVAVGVGLLVHRLISRWQLRRRGADPGQLGMARPQA